MNYPIYVTGQRGGDGLDSIVIGDVNAVGALKSFARESGIDDYSIDTASGKVFLCPSHSRRFYYTYLDRVGDREHV